MNGEMSEDHLQRQTDQSRMSSIGSPTPLRMRWGGGSPVPPAPRGCRQIAQRTTPAIGGGSGGSGGGRGGKGSRLTFPPTSILDGIGNYGNSDGVHV